MNTKMNSRPSDKPFVPEGEHPIHTKRYVITTPQVEGLCTNVVTLIDNRTPGCVVYAPPRTGKSAALTILKLELATVYPGLPIMLLPVWDYSVPNQRAFMEDLLVAAGHAIIKRGTPEDKRDRLVELMAQLALEGGRGIIVLLVDEAQQLHEKHYRWLMGIHNLLSLRSVHLITILVGQHQLTHQRTAFLRAQKENIVGRFMVHMFEFRGLHTAKEAELTLTEFDQEEYPAESGWSFTRYFAPTPFNCGWRLSQIAPILWQSFMAAKALAAQPPKSKQSRAAKLPKGNQPNSGNDAKAGRTDIPMQYFCRTVEYILMHINGADLSNEDAVRNLTTTAIAASGYLDVLIIK
jgi:hypothetical protein